jgi:membrane peptidoglycan carboxypeptidase
MNGDQDDYQGNKVADHKQGQLAAESPGGIRRALGCFGRVLTLGLQLFLAGLIVGIILATGGYFYLSNQLGNAIEQVVAYQGQGAGGTPRFFDRHGRLLFELRTAEKRRWLAYDELPPVVIAATIAVEDDTFWSNPGFDPAAIVAALISNYRNVGDRPVGASTITQQLVRMVAFTYEERITPSYDRKIREVFLAAILTRQRSKQDILLMYLNEIYYGNLAYGIEAAAQTYFGKPAGELNLAEAAFLAGLPQAPVELDPYNHLTAAKERQEFILDLMVADGGITAMDAEVAKAIRLELAPLIPVEVEVAGTTLEAPHFVLYVQDYLEQRFGADALTRGGWQVTTSLDLSVQALAEQAVRDQVAARADAHDVNNGATVVMKPATGEILAMVGSRDYFDGTIDGQVNVTLSPRQPGSSIKPLTYAAAMERGWTTADVIWDVPIALEAEDGTEFVPVNYDRRFHGPLLLRDALANSYNIPPVQIIRDIGVTTMIATTRRMGVESLTEPAGFYGLTLTLGGGEVTLLELTHAFASLANGGQRPHLTSVLRIEDSRGQVIFDNQRDRVPPTNALDPRIAYILTDILDDDNARRPAFGTNHPLDPPYPAAVKTGTTNDFRDNWTLGYTPSLVVGVWLGNTDGHPMRDSSGLRGAAPVWRAIMDGVLADVALADSLRVDGILPPQEFTRPAGIEEKSVCLPRGAGGGICGATRNDLFLISGPQRGVSRLGYMPDTLTNPGAWTLSVLPMPAAAARQVSFPPLSNGYQPPPPTHCVLNSGRTVPGSTTRLYLPVPPHYPDEVRARLWAAQNGYHTMAPPIACPISVIQQVRAAAAQPPPPAASPTPQP